MFEDELNQLEEEYEEEYKRRVDCGYLADSELGYDRAEARERYWDMEIHKFYK